jgi:hypothetical protein
LSTLHETPQIAEGFRVFYRALQKNNREFAWLRSSAISHLKERP